MRPPWVGLTDFPCHRGEHVTQSKSSSIILLLTMVASSRLSVESKSGKLKPSVDFSTKVI